ncbi:MULTISPECIES: hypothetical protein [Marinomonas]|uniref:Uncharacterized protein n=1 Tax=Marinomonas arctica TaxID=383750 RepID=A0A7H1J7R7_9GAMM|nr:MULTISPECIES: hypothetical protein [Marinomonas]QNT06533.1 hypothetical protein IBG28_02405 [Marinomonas arctica]
MSMTSSYNAHQSSAQTKLFGCVQTMSLAQWLEHYQAETVDLRYFFHSGWSS